MTNRVEFMSAPSNWPLPKSSIRYLIPKPMIEQLELNVVSRGLFPLAFGYYENAHNHAIKRLEHTDHLLIFCCAGKGTISSPHYNQTIVENDILMIPKGTTHHYKADSKDPWSIYWVHMDGHLFMQFMDIIGLNKSQLKIQILNPIQIKNEFEQLMETRHQGYQLNSFILAANILKKILSLLTMQLPALHVTPQKDFNLITFNAFLEENITKQLSLDEMASYMGLSKFHFAKKFQTATGISPVKYFLEIKIQHACGLLDRSSKSIKDVAAVLGYDDPYYFSRLFKNVMGLSPKQYRLSRHGH
ncbi:AraC family transcriptional regulator [Psychrosphaera sp. F3M07]|jgi:AraC family transcriptional regulator of arabinose operon|uniref:helix-turn-helix transcriptional regulator n=1 Tax=Psychrosphaera sp. F3M07 TaxID=2841560 RepID=UPI001C089CF1|nr:AraC family transcriptional regulator [Psychrosphaera sp. F3M07]MBU2917341.1 AraC family transcriptional regulator [Psychrosphaera sp. F3M07]